MSEVFPKSSSLGVNLEVKLDLSYHAAKTDLKNATGVDTSFFT